MAGTWAGGFVQRYESNSVVAMARGGGARSISEVDDDTSPRPLGLTFESKDTGAEDGET